MTGKDKTAPRLDSSIPIKGAKSISIDQNLVLTFNEEVNIGTGSILISNSSGDLRNIPAISKESIEVKF